MSNVTIALCLTVSIYAISCTTTGTDKCDMPINGTPTDGRVVALADIDKYGEPHNVRITESVPQGMWDEKVICLIQKRRVLKDEKGKMPPFKNYKFSIDVKMTD